MDPVAVSAFALVGAGVVVGILAAAMLRRIRAGRGRHRRTHRTDDDDPEIEG